MKIFTSEEEDYLFDHSRFSDDFKDCTNKDNWCRMLDTYTSCFSDEATVIHTFNRLFSLPKCDDLASYCFFPLCDAIVQQVGLCPGNEIFEDNAFSGWDSKYLSDVQRLWMPSITIIIEKITGEMPLRSSEYKKWLSDTVSPLSRQGRIFHDLALEYPVLARQIIQFTYYQAEHIKSLILDTYEFSKTIEAKALNVYNEKVVSVSAPGSDRHQNGRTVHILTYENGVKLVYKPHSTAIDRAFGKWVNFISDRAGYGHFPYPNSVDFGDVSFCEYISPEPLDSPEQAKDFFRNAGLLFGAVYFLKGNDMHQENIISHGIYPISIDMETILLPEDSILARCQDTDLSYRVSDLLFLPTLGPLPGFHCSPFDSLTSTNETCSNLPTFDNTVYNGRNYVEEICEGFKKAVTVGSKYIDELVQLMFEEFPGCQVRLIIQPTSVYFNISLVLAKKECIHDREIYERMLSKLEKFGISRPAADNAYILNTEKQAIKNLDIPYFTDTLRRQSLLSIPDWIKTRKESLVDDLAMIRWALKEHHVFDGSDKPLLNTTEISNTEDNLYRMAQLISKSLETDSLCICACQENDEYRICSTADTIMPFLDAGLGSLIALGAYLKLYPDNEIDRKFKDKLNELYTDKYYAPAITTSSLGLADGTGGFLLGSLMLYEMGYIGDEKISMITTRVEQMSSYPLKIKYSSSDILHGAGGLYVAIKRLPDKFVTDEISKLLNQLSDNISNAQTETLTYDVMTYLSKELREKTNNDYKPVCNQSFRYGNAGKLYNLVDSNKRSDHISEEHALMQNLLNTNSVLPDAGIPNGIYETGLLSGLPGVLYTICKALNSKVIPGLM